MRVCVLVVLAGCSSSGTKMQGDCALDASASGGVTWDSSSDHSAQLGCGAVGSNGTELDVEEYGGNDAYHELAILFDTPIAAGQTGTVTATVSLTADDGGSATRSTWKSAAGACSIELTKNVSMPDSFFKHKYVIAGDGTCTGDLTDEAGMLPPVTLDPFTFQSFDDYSP